MSGDRIAELVAELRARPDCRLEPPRGQARVRDGLVVPSDLVRFHELCGGAMLFLDADLPLRVSGPDELVPAAPRLLTVELAADAMRDEPESPVSTTYVIVDNGTGGATDEHVVIDLHPDRLGRCHETFWDRFGPPEDSPLVAESFTDLVPWLLATEGEGLETEASS